MIYREHYIAPIRDFYDDDLIKVITGIRRCGKSVVLNQIMDEIKEKTDNVIYLNFEDKRTNLLITNGIELINYVNENRKDGKCYLFFDEIQVLSGWQDACKTLRLYDNSLFITGSNFKLLSKEFTKELSGRYVSFRIKPFVYKEILEYTKQLGKDCSVSDYLVWGGFPKRFEFSNEAATIRYLTDLDDTIVINDLINRYKIRKVDLFHKIVNFVLRSNSRIISSKSIYKFIQDNHEKCSINTVIKYLGYLEEAYIIDKISLYSNKVKRELIYYYKIYNEDVSFNSIRCLDNRYDLSHNLENIVYNELIYMGYQLYVYDNRGKEIDFLAVKDNKKYYIQVAYSILDDKAYEREFKAFEGFDNMAKRIIITNDDIDYSTSLVQHIKLKDFLLMDSLD